MSTETHHQHNHHHRPDNCCSAGGEVVGFPSKSLESLYSVNSGGAASSSAAGKHLQPASLNMYKRKPARPTANTGPVSEVRQRVLSARMHRIRNIQNQLGDAQIHIAELLNENRLLRTLHKRQDLALTKYESTNAELPQLLHSHAEEIRMWQARVRNLQAQNKELAARLKQKDSVLLGISDQNKHLHQLNSDKNLEERERLTERVAYLEMRLQDKDEEMKVCLRRSQLESKSLRSHMMNEQGKVRDLQHKLEVLTNESMSESNKSSSSLLPVAKQSQSRFVSKLLPPRKAITKRNLSVAAGSGLPDRPNVISTLAFPSKAVNFASEPTRSDTKNDFRDDSTVKLTTRSVNFDNTATTDTINSKPKALEKELVDLAHAVRSAMSLPSSERLPKHPERSIDTLEETIEEDDDNDVMNGSPLVDVNDDEEEDTSGEDEEEYDAEEPQWDEDVSEDDDDDEDGEDGAEEAESSGQVDDDTDTSADTFRKRTPISIVNPTPKERIPSPLDDIAQIRSNQRREIMRDESLLDSLCDNVVKTSQVKIDAGGGGDVGTVGKPMPKSNWPVARASGVPVSTHRMPLDPKKKLMLQQALRAIDSS